MTQEEQLEEDQDLISELDEQQDELNQREFEFLESAQERVFTFNKPLSVAQRDWAEDILDRIYSNG